MQQRNPMEALYQPDGVESRWQGVWEAEGLYAAGAGASREESYVICVPPPNVTGDLHLGHALNGSIQDVLVRWHRMRGYRTLWQPGYDHAGISTQNVVEKQLAGEGLTRHDLGREAFIERTWQWLEQTGRTIMGQYRRLGASLDYSRERFTLDEGYSRAVTAFFVRLWERGWIYRANRIVNWCPFHQTAISDLEVEHEEMDDVLSYVRYPFRDGDGTDGIVIATARPATILGDVAVAVHPNDGRYSAAVGREVVVPYVERPVPVIADVRVDPAFGSGALKITPGHDPVDFEIGRAHALPEPMVIGLDGRMNDQAGDLEGLTQAEADAAVIAWVKDRGQLVRRENYRHAVGTCERCHSRIEPLISLQWWCRMEEPVQPALEALRERRVRYHPESQHRFAIASLEATPDWCLSRQLWWGHQLPIWTTPEGEAICAATEEEAQERAGSGVALTRDPDVLDTWFSSALWPLATLGWPDETPELAAYYPGNVNSTAREIIRLWENRMIWTGLEVMGEVPFTDVIIHSTVLAADGRRMSKSLGTGVDPLEMIDAHGADATRYGLLKISSTQDVRFSAGAIEEGRKLANKLWNVSRLILQNAEGVEAKIEPSALEERWILARIDAAREQVEEAWAAFDFATATNVLYHLTFDDFCDWYAEAVKPRLYEHEAAASATALAALERLLTLLHPMVPHVTEEIWSYLPGARSRLIVSAWLSPDGRFRADGAALERVQEAAVTFRRSGVQVALDSDDERRVFAAVVRPERQKAPAEAGPEIARLEKEIARAEAMLANERFVGSAPPAVVEGERAKLERFTRELEALAGIGS
jgi:valyl-tRNA synthetase